MKRVVIIETQLKHYRENFVVQLATTLRESGVSLAVGYSEPSQRERDKADTVELSGSLGVKLPVRTWWNDRIVLQLAWQLVRDADLVIVGQGNGLLFNYLLIALSQLGVKRVAYWGHGFNHQAKQPGLSEWFKRRLLTRVDWWFAYTTGVARYLEAHGVDRARISTVHNTIDVVTMRADIAAADLATVRRRVGVGATAPIGIYCGALIEEKQLGFLLDAAAEVRRIIPTFELIVVGDGPERSMLEAIAHYRAFVHVVGAAFGVERSSLFAIADICLLPAYAGLAIVDAFAAGIPVATTDHDGHGPERDYLVAGVNSVISRFDVDAYARMVADVLADPHTLARGARQTGSELSLRKMVDEFASGIIRCVGSE